MSEHEHLYHQDFVRDIIGDLWRGLIKVTSRDVLGQALQDMFQDRFDDPLPTVLWSACRIELSDETFRRIAVILTADVGVARAIAEMIGTEVICPFLEQQVADTPPTHRLALAAGCLYFMLDVEVTLSTELLRFASKTYQTAIKRAETDDLDILVADYRLIESQWHEGR